ncbi:MAG: hypothetical protein V4516_01075 [Pseudomonadota bacterium]
MDWDQIESKWAAMARRVRADVQYSPLSVRTRNTLRAISDRRAGPMTDRQGGDRPDTRSALHQE